MKINKIAMALVPLIALTGCKTGALTATKEVKRSYVVFDVKADNTQASQIAASIKSALQETVPKVRIVEDFPPNPLPDVAPRFQLASPFAKGSAFAALGAQVKIPTCDGALIYAQGSDSSFAKYGEQTDVFVCLWQYQDGYHVDVYSQFQIQSGGLMNLGVDMVRGAMGDSSKFIPRIVNTIQSELEQRNAVVTLVESYPSELTASR